MFLREEAVQEFEWMRQVRNATEYPAADRPTATRQDVEEAIEAASKIVTACARHMRASG
ncbi:HEPN domain-containing protein [Nesterenkonia flava]|uniref:HEPN domain-containing protein n=1 Tax=Nesterenkonia flava TaxID=469799 RepID=UPI0035B5D0E7